MEPDKRKWHVDKGIPVALIVSMASALFLGGMAYQSLTGKQEKFSEKQSEFSAKLEKTDAKVDALSSSIQSGSVPSALNQRRIEELERLVGQVQNSLGQLSNRVQENERKLSTEAIRNRAARER